MQKKSVTLLTDATQALTAAVKPYADAIRIAQDEIAHVQRRSKAQPSRLSERITLLEQEVERFFSNDALRRYFVDEHISARTAAERGVVLSDAERDDIEVGLKIAGSALAEIRRACAAMPAAIAAAEQELAEAEYILSGFRSPAHAPADAQAAPLPHDLRDRLSKVFAINLPAGATFADAISAQRERAADEGEERLAEWVAYQQQNGTQP